jgi:hypothetical protein
MRSSRPSPTGAVEGNEINGDLMASIRGQQIRDVVETRKLANKAARDEANAMAEEPLAPGRVAQAALDEVQAELDAMRERIGQGNPPSPEERGKLEERAKSAVEGVRSAQDAGLESIREHQMRFDELRGEFKSLHRIEETVRFVEQHPENEDLARRSIWTLVDNGIPEAAGVLDELVALDPWWTRPPE